MASYREVLRALLFVFACGCASAVMASEPEAHFPTSEDLRHVQGMSDPQLSPGGEKVLVQITDATADGGRSHLWLVDIASNSSRQLTWSSAEDVSGERKGRWMPNGDILFLARRGEHTRLYRLPMQGGEARAYDLKVAPQVESSRSTSADQGTRAAAEELIAIDVQDFAISPDGSTVAVLARDPQSPQEKKRHPDKDDALWVDHDPHGVRLYLLSADSNALTPVAVAPDVKDVSWSPSGERLIALTRGPNNVDDLAFSGAGWLVRREDPGHPARIESLPDSIEIGAWSLDGRQYFFLARLAVAPPDCADLYVLTFADRSVRNLSSALQGSLNHTAPIPVADGVLQSVRLGTRQVFMRFGAATPESIGLNTPHPGQLQTNSTATGWVWLGSSSVQPLTLYYSPHLSSDGRALSTPSLVPGKWPAIQPTLVRWKNQGLEIEGLLYLPPTAKTQRVPMVVDVHGGPTSCWTDFFDPMAEYLLGQGWAVFRPNPRGSTGYGAAFVVANRNDLGGADYRDIMTGVDRVLRDYPIDPGRLALTGYSYGGQMAAFVEGRTDRFKAIVGGSPVTDVMSEYGTEYGSWYDRWFFGRPWEHPVEAWRQSPMARVAHAKTPFLILEGDEDEADPLGQSLELYRALRQVGVHVELVRYPREDHAGLAWGMWGVPRVGEPWHGLDARNHLTDFISKAFEPAAGSR